MLKRARLKNTIRNITRGKISFISLCLIFGLAAGGFICSKSLSYTLKQQAENYYLSRSFEDLSVASNTGISEGDVEKIRALDAVREAEGVFVASGKLNYAGSSRTVDVISDTKRVSLPELISGRLPEAPGECALDLDLAEEEGIELSDRLSIELSGRMEGSLKESDFTVTGFVRHPEYLRRKVGNFVLIPYRTVDSDALGNDYTKAIVLYELPEDKDIYSSEYKAEADKAKAEIEKLTEELSRDHDEDFRGRAEAALSAAEKDAESELEKASSEIEAGERELRDARICGERELANGRSRIEEELNAAEEELRNAEAEYLAALEKAENELKEAEEEAESKLGEAKAQIDEGEAEYREGKEELEKAEEEYASSRAEYEKEVSKAEEEIASAKELLSSGRSKLSSGVRRLENEIDERIDEAEKLIGSFGADNETARAIASDLLELAKENKEEIDAYISRAQSGIDLIREMLENYDEDDIEELKDICETAIDLIDDIIEPSSDPREKLRDYIEMLRDINAIVDPDGSEPAYETALAALELFYDELGDNIEELRVYAGELKDMLGNVTELIEAGEDVRDKVEESLDKAEGILAIADIFSFSLDFIDEDYLLVMAGSLVEMYRDDLEELWNSSIEEVRSKANTAKAEAAIALIDRGTQIYLELVPESARELPSLKAVYSEIIKLREDLSSALDTIRSAQSSIRFGSESLTSAKNQFEKQKKNAEDKLSEAEKEIAEGREELKTAEDALSSARAEYEEGRTDAEAKLSAAREEYERAREEGANQLDEGRSTLESERERAYSELGTAEREVRAEIAKGEKELRDGKAEYEKAKEDASKALEEARSEALSSIPATNFILQGLDLNSNYQTVHENIRSSELVSLFVTSVFMLIAILVCFSTLTILVDKQRRLIGAEKAMGFYRKEVAGKYLAYGILAAITGGLIALALQAVLGGVIIGIYQDMFIFDCSRSTLDLSAALLTLPAILIISALTSYLSVRHYIKEPASRLMSGERPGRSRKILSAGGAGSIYSRLILRNMRTEAPRVFLSTVIIAAGILVMGVGISLNDSFNGMLDLQAERVLSYDFSISTDSSLSEEEKLSLEEALNKHEASYLRAYYNNYIYSAGEYQSAGTVVVPEREPAGFIELRELESGERLELQKDGVIIFSRLAEAKKVGLGDELSFTDNELNTYKTEASGIFHNYQSALFIMSEESYIKTFSKEPKYNRYLVKAGEDTRESLLTELEPLSSKIQLEEVDSYRERYGSIIRIYRFVVVAMLGVAIVLSFMVLTNLVAIFVNGKKKELITMRINGFSRGEALSYLARETAFTNLLGSLTGVAIGIPFAYLTVRAMESVHYELVRSVDVRAWIFAVLIELCFSLVINFFAFRRALRLKLTDIDKV